MVSDIGNVYSKITNTILKPEINVDGYYRVQLSRNGSKKNFKIHRLVAIAFIENPNNLRCVNHIDENKLNNNVSNLEWCTSKYNANYGTRNARMSETKRKNPKTKKICQYDIDGNFIKEWNGLSDASKSLNISISQISKCCTNRIKHANNFIFKYA